MSNVDKDYWMGYCYFNKLNLYVVVNANKEILTSDDGIIWKKLKETATSGNPR